MDHEAAGRLLGNGFFEGDPSKGELPADRQRLLAIGLEPFLDVVIEAE